MGGEPGGISVGVETADVLGEHPRLSAIGGIDLDPEPMCTPCAPFIFMLRDMDGNTVVVVENRTPDRSSHIDANRTPCPGEPAAGRAPQGCVGTMSMCA